MKKAVNLILLLLLILASLAIAYHGSLYLSFDPDHGFLENKEPLIKGQVIWQVAFYTHVMGGVIALLIGPWQFIRSFRQKNWHRHRLLGKIYFYAIMIASPLGFYTAIFADHGLMSKLGFALLAIAWFYTTYRAWRYIQRKDQKRHEEWMIRSFAVTFAAVTFRVWFIPESILGIPFDISYMLNSWLCWMVNLIFAEILILRKRHHVIV